MLRGISWRFDASDTLIRCMFGLCDDCNPSQAHTTHINFYRRPQRLPRGVASSQAKWLQLLLPPGVSTCAGLQQRLPLRWNPVVLYHVSIATLVLTAASSSCKRFLTFLASDHSCTNVCGGKLESVLRGRFFRCMQALHRSW